MCALQRQETVRFVRGEQEALTLLAAGHVFARPGRTWVVLVNGTVAAWFSVASPDRAAGSAALAVREMAGSRLAVFAALPGILRTMGAQSAEIDARASDREFEILAGAFSLRSEPRGFHGTMKIIDVPGFLHSLRGLLAERAGGVAAGRLAVEPGAPIRFNVDGQSLIVESVEDAAALFFGSTERAIPAVPAGPLADALSGIFPIQFPAYGLNYI